jgi:hypothetical protein
MLQLFLFEPIEPEHGVKSRFLSRKNVTASQVQIDVIPRSRERSATQNCYSIALFHIFKLILSIFESRNVSRLLCLFALTV